MLVCVRRMRAESRVFTGGGGDYPAILCVPIIRRYDRQTGQRVLKRGPDPARPDRHLVMEHNDFE